MAGQPLEQQQQTIRVPLYATESQRVSNYNASDSRLLQDQFLVNCYPISFKDPLQADKPVTKIQSRMGWDFPNETVSLAGIITNTTTAYVKCCMTMAQLDDTLVICYVDGTNFRFVEYRPITGTASTIGVIPFAHASGPYTADDYVHLSELTIGDVPYLGVVVSNAGRGGGSSGWYAASVGGVLTVPPGAGMVQITDVDYPPNASYSRKAVGPLVQLNNVVYQMTEGGYIHGSEVSAAGASQIAVWNNLGYTQAVSYPDRGLGLCRYKHHLVAFGEETIEFFNDEGLAPPRVPIARTEQAFIKLGAINQKAFLNVDDTLWWIGKSYTGHINLYRLEGYSPVNVGQATQARLISDRPYTAHLQVMTMHGIRHLITNIRAQAGVSWFDDGVHTGDIVELNPELRGNLIYAIDSNTWWIWSTEHNVFGDNNIESLYTTTMFQNGTVTRICFSNVRSTGGGFTYALHPRMAFPYFEATQGTGYYDAYRVDNSVLIDPYRIPVMIGTPSYDFGNNNRKFIRKANLICDYIRNVNPGGAPFDTFNSEGLTLNFGVDTTDDLANNMNPEQRRATDLLANPGYRYYFNNVGSGRQHKFIWAINTYVPLRFDSMELNIAQGTH